MVEREAGKFREVKIEHCCALLGTRFKVTKLEVAGHGHVMQKGSAYLATAASGGGGRFPHLFG